MSAPVARSTEVIPLDAIDAPDLDARLTRDPEKLEELARDILRRGLIEPIKVFRNAERFEVVDGYRRYLASKSAGLSTIECFVYATKAVALEGIKYAANIFREDMSPADEAVMFHQLLGQECGGDIERLAALVGKKITYVDARLQLALGDEDVFEAVKARQIGLGVAAELNKIDKSDWRRYYLEHAVKTGATTAVVIGWVQDYRKLFAAAADVAMPEQPAAAGGFTGTPHDPMRCAVCLKSDHRIPVTVYVHPSCLEAILTPLLATYRGEV